MTRLIVVFDFFLARRVEVLLTRTVHPVLNEEKAMIRQNPGMPPGPR